MANVPARRRSKQAGKPKRDYQAEYRRRLQLAEQRGQTKSQARRGAKKYAQAQLGPRGGVGEHGQRARTTAERYRARPQEVTRQRLATRSTRFGGHDYDIQTFHRLDNALEFIGTLGPGNRVYMLGHGPFRKTEGRYQTEKRGWAALSGWGRPAWFTGPGSEAVAARDEELFTPHASTYEVRWTPEGGA